jgi:hypothetical protein
MLRQELIWQGEGVGYPQTEKTKRNESMNLLLKSNTVPAATIIQQHTIEMVYLCGPFIRL